MFYAKGFENLDHEVSRVALNTSSGEVPSWLHGTLLRNGPGRFNLGSDDYRHWFDGLAMLHGFYFRDGQVHYSNRFLRTPAYTDGMAHNKICYSAFATVPNYTWWQALIAWFRQPESGANNGVSIARLGDDYLALTESADLVTFDADSLHTRDVVEFDDAVSGEITSAHPHYDYAAGQLINFNVKLGRRPEYLYFRCSKNVRERELIGRIPVDKPSYTHSFALTEKYIVHVDFPLVVNSLRLRFGNVPYINCYRWQPERGTRFTVLAKAGGNIVKQFHADACFAFHHVNAYEQGNAVIVDMAAKPDASVVDDLYLQHLRTCQGRPIRQPSTLRRYQLPLNGGDIREEEICDEYLEMPTINYRRHNARDYRFVYGIGSYQGMRNDFENQLIKIDTVSGRRKIWYQENCYPWEPVFVPHPGSDNEDHGILLSVVLDGAADSSFLLLLNAEDLQELARLPLPHPVPLGFHGQYFSQV